MNNLYKEEEKASEEFSLEFDAESGLVRLTRRNVALIEAMLKIDSRYRKCFDITAAPNKKYEGSSAYWFCHLNENYEENIQKVINALDRENSTHLNADQRGREELKERILQETHTVQDLKNLLIDKQQYEKLYDKLAGKTNPNEKYTPRKNPSFASKFCHFASFFLLGEKYTDDYSIYDSVIRENLPKYLDYYDIEYSKNDLDDYLKYNDKIGELLEASSKYEKERISRNGFDHLVWYYYK